MRCLIPFVLVAACSIQSAYGETTILGRTQSNGSGVEIVAGGWTEAVHSDASYQAFYKVRNGKLGRYDFYYALQIVPQFKEKYRTCDQNPNFASYFRALLGISKAALVVVKADIQYRWTTGIPVDFLKGDAGLVLAATGTGASAATPGNGCFFDQTLRPTFPLLQYGGGGPGQNYDDFVIKFIVVGGRSENLNAVSNVVSLFSKISAAAGWSAVTSAIGGAAFQNFQNAAQTFQSALQAAGTIQNQVAVSYTLKSNGGPDDGRIVITIPQLFGGSEANGNMAIYVRRQGSIVLADLDPNKPNPPITTQTVLQNQELPGRQCNPVGIAGGNCNSNNDTIRTALAKVLKGIDPGLGDGTNPIIRLFDVNSDRQKKVYEMCEGMRTVSIMNMHLSTLDETLVRWAFAKESGLLDTLNDTAKAAALAAANNKSTDDLKSMCWNPGDEDTIERLAQALHTKFQ